MKPQTSKTYLTAAEVAQRYRITSMTLHRWLRDPEVGFPEPLVICKRRLFDAAALNAFDEQKRESAR